MEEIFITEEYLNENPNHIFVFGDNLLRVGTGGAAKLRHLNNAYGFITKRMPNCTDDAYYKPDEEFRLVVVNELVKLVKMIKENPDKLFLISKLGAGLANKFMIFEKIIKSYLFKLRNKNFKNVKFLFDLEE